MSRLRQYKKLGLLPLAAVIFLTVSGGPYGLEPLLYYGGKNGAFLFLLITPLLWDTPAILTVMELNSMMPVNGGYYVWVKKALGQRLGFYEGWWSWLYSFTDLAIYPVLFVTYISFFFPQAILFKIPVCLCFIWGSALLNILGINPVGKISLLLGALVLIPFLLLSGITVYHLQAATITPPSLDGISFSMGGMALYTVMWNFIGWDNVTTYAAEVERPVHTYIKGIIIAFMITVSVYAFAVFAAQHTGVTATALRDQGFPVLGLLTAGHWLGVLLAIGGMASSLGIFSAVLLSVSRIPKVMADDNLMPAGLNKLHGKYGTPYISIIVCAAAVSLMVSWDLAGLVIIDIIIYGAGLILEFISLVIFRIKEPGMERPFKIPLGVKGLCCMLLLPVAIYVIAFISVLQSESTLRPVIFAVVALGSAEVSWQVVTRKAKH